MPRTSNYLVCSNCGNVIGAVFSDDESVFLPDDKVACMTCAHKMPNEPLFVHQPLYVVAEGKGPFEYKRIHRLKIVDSGYLNQALVRTWCGQGLLHPSIFNNPEEAIRKIHTDNRRAEPCSKCSEAGRASA